MSPLSGRDIIYQVEVPTRGSEMESSDAVRLTEIATDDALT